MLPERAPLYEKLVETERRQYARFHVPGHKAALPGSDGRFTGFETYKSIMAIDMTEIAGLDDLHQPDGVIQQAQELAASCFGAEETFFLVNGSTSGNLAMIMSVCDQGDLVLMQRNVHKSAIHACMLAGCKVAFITPELDSQSGIFTGVSAEYVREALQQYPEAKAVFITNPNYYGMGGDIASLANAVHAHGVPLLVDEAHGAHYGFHPGVPASAMAEGADAAVQSTHKMLTSLTMGAMLHIQGELIDRSIIRQRLAMLQSSSPSYPIMASLDLSRRLMHTDGKALIDAALQRVVNFGQQLAELSDSYELLQPAPTDTYTTLDPFKIAIRSARGTLSGYQLQQLLEEYGCVAEMADPRYVLLALSLHTSEKDLARAIEALRQIAVSSLPSTKQQTIDSYIIEETNWNQAAMSSRVSLPAIIQLPAVRGNGQATEVVKLSDAIDRVAAEMVIPYPPGIPILYPGESVTAATAACLTELARLGARFQGCRDITLQSILVTK